MHDILRLKGAFISQKSPKNTPRLRNLPVHHPVSAKHLLKLADQLTKIHAYWEKHPLIGGSIISVHYRQVIAKSNRIQQLLRDGTILPYQSIRGAKFERDNQDAIHNHVFTHFVSQKALLKSAEDLKAAANILSQYFNNLIKRERKKACPAVT